MTDDIHDTTRAAQLARCEVCTCGHTRGMHRMAFAQCLCKRMGKPCDCVRFTWDAKHAENQRLLAEAARIEEPAL